MSFPYRFVALAMALVCCATMAFAEGIEPGLWKITTRVDQGGTISPPLLSSKCLTEAQAKDVPEAFTPVSSTVNSTCAPIERHFDGRTLSWRLVCTGQFNVELNGNFDFDSPRHYLGSVRSRTAMVGQGMSDTRQLIEGEWTAEKCQ